MKPRCINHPKNEPISFAQEWYLDPCDGNPCAAFIVGSFHLSHVGLAAPIVLLTASKAVDLILGGWKKETVTNSLDLLVGNGLLEAYGFGSEEAKDFCVSKNKTGTNSSTYLICEWCKRDTLLLQDHHYPIPKRLGGKQVVSICGTCHTEFHHLADSKFYRSTARLTNLFDLHPLTDRAIALIKGGWA